MHGDRGVGAAGGGVARIGDGGGDGAVIGDGVVLHPAVVQAHVQEPPAVWRPGVTGLRRAGGQLLFVHPVEAAVEDRVTPVGGDAAHPAVGDVDVMEVVPLHV